MEDDRVMADNKLAFVFDSLPHDGGGDVQRGQHTVHGLTRIDEQADVSQSNASSCGATARRKPKICWYAY